MDLEKEFKRIKALPGPDPMNEKDFEAALKHERAEEGHASGGIGSILPGVLIGAAMGAGGAFALQYGGIDPSLGMFPNQTIGLLPLAAVGSVAGGLVDHHMDKSHEDHELKQAYARYLKHFEGELTASHSRGHGAGGPSTHHGLPAHAQHSPKGPPSQHIG
jgi:hypothetical protein